MNTDKTKIIELLDKRGNNNTESLAFEKVNEYRYQGTVLSTKNNWAWEIGLKIVKAERASFAISKFLKSKVFSKKIKA